ncbi:MAG: hypothetical protein Q4A56_08280 [Porphyromonadaceae bacterium]|nr:hypothetical protein [Porphyromonadaceae bacterium]
MIYIDINKLNIIEAREIHIKELTPKILKKVSESQFQEIKDFLTEERIKHILEDFPNELYQIHCDFSSIINNVSITTALRKIIDYDNFIEKKKTMYDAYDLAEKLDIPTCPYCERMYTKTVISEKGKKIVRPDFDHWFPKSKYPLLALSFYNLIPSCNVCNSGLKGDDAFELGSLFHPYHKAEGFKYTFSYDLDAYQKPRVKILAEKGISKDSVKAFELEEIYKTHQDEVEDLLKIRQAYSENYIEILNRTLEGANLTREEVYRLVFGAHLAEDEFDRRPLSKIKRDILTELRIVKPEMK